MAYLAPTPNTISVKRSYQHNKNTEALHKKAVYDPKVYVLTFYAVLVCNYFLFPLSFIILSAAIPPFNMLLQIVLTLSLLILELIFSGI